MQFGSTIRLTQAQTTHRGYLSEPLRLKISFYPFTSCALAEEELVFLSL